MNNTVLVKYNMLISSYLFYQSVSVEEDRNAVDLMFCSAECADVASRAASNLALQNVLMWPAEQQVIWPYRMC
jgi:hypothetical protein